MAPELVQAFVPEFDAELRVRAAQAGNERIRGQKQLQAIDRRIAGIVRAIEDGAYTASLKERLTALEAEMAVIEARLAEINAPAPVTLHPNTPDLYRTMVANLAEALSAPETRVEAVDIIRELVDRVELRPNKDGGLDAVLYGDLAAMLSAPHSERRTANDPDRGSGSLLSVVAGRGFEPLTFRL